MIYLPLSAGIPVSDMPAWMPSGVPPGAVMAYAGEIDDSGGTPVVGTAPLAPWGWMICDGRQLKIGDYPFLYAALGTRYNQQGDSDASLFRIPDYRGYFLRTVSGSSGNDKDSGDRKMPDGSTGDSVGSIQQDALQTHVHSYLQPNGGATPSQSGAALATPPNVTQQTGIPETQTGAVVPVKVSDNETRPMNIYVYYIIKFI
jgi:microcystin-dependent protein